MGREVTIRDAVEGDLPAIVEIYNSTIPSRVVSADLAPISVGDREAWFWAHGPERRPLWVADEEGEVVGWLSLGDFFDGRPAYHATAEIGVYVREDRRGGGLGRRLLREAIDRGPALGIKTLTAGVFAHNEPSLELFTLFGFEEWARFPKVAELDGVERDLLILGLRIQE